MHSNTDNRNHYISVDDGHYGLWCGVPSNEGHALMTGITTSHIHLCHVDASGSLIGVWSHARTWATPEFTITELTGMEMALLADGGLILTYGLVYDHEVPELHGRQRHGRSAYFDP